MGMEEIEGLKGSGSSSRWADPDFPGSALLPFGDGWDEGSGCGQGDLEGQSCKGSASGGNKRDPNLNPQFPSWRDRAAKDPLWVGIKTPDPNPHIPFPRKY